MSKILSFKPFVAFFYRYLKKVNMAEVDPETLLEWLQMGQGNLQYYINSKILIVYLSGVKGLS